MNCLECQKNFSLFRDHQLNSRKLNKLESHLQNCPHCQMQWREWQKSLDLLHNLSCLSAPSSLAQMVHQQIRQSECQKLSRFSRIFTYKVWFMALSLVAVLFMAFFTLHNSEPASEDLLEKPGNPKHILAVNDTAVSVCQLSPASQTHSIKEDDSQMSQVTLRIEENQNNIKYQVKAEQEVWQKKDLHGSPGVKLSPQEWKNLIQHLHFWYNPTKNIFLPANKFRLNAAF